MSHSILQKRHVVFLVSVTIFTQLRAFTLASSAECSTSVKNSFGQAPVDVLLDVSIGEFGAIEGLAGGCICSNGKQRLYFYPQLSYDCLSCVTSIVNAFIACQNYTELCVLGANGEFYTPASVFPSVNVYTLLHSLCDRNGGDCQMYLGISNFLQNATGLALRAGIDGSIVQFADNIFPMPIGPKSGLLPFKALSCHGCASLSDSSCDGAFKEGVVN